LPTTSLSLTTEFREHCGSIGGCAAYVAVIPVGEASPVETRLGTAAGDRQALSALEAGSYVIRFRLAAVSDVSLDGAPRDETTIATCEMPLEVASQSAVHVTVTFEGDSCEASGSSTLTIID
jgi:hypothetical protein